MRMYAIHTKIEQVPVGLVTLKVSNKKPKKLMSKSNWSPIIFLCELIITLPRYCYHLLYNNNLKSELQQSMTPTVKISTF